MKKILCYFTIISAVFILSGSAYSGNLNKVTILRTGSAPSFENSDLNRSGHVIWATHSSWSGNRVFFLSSDLGDPGLAIFLAAISTSKTVYLEIGGSASAPNTAGSIISRAYLNSY